VTTLRAALAFACLAPLLHAAPLRAAEAPLVGPPLDPQQMERFFDAYLERALAVHHVAGAAVYVVKEGQVLFKRGYGLADVERGEPVDPDRTVFPIGSLSKLFTWTAVMQLAEEGKLDLDADVNRYLDFSIPATFPQPITLRHLMSHTAGFEDRRFGQLTDGPAPSAPLGAWLRAHLPARVRPPGELTAYQNYGAALAGYAVERASGLPYDEYVERRILRPLGMGHTTSRQPPPEALRAAAARPYRWVDGALQLQPALDVAANVGPAASFRTTAADMARFLAAHLEGGRLGDAVILQPDTVDRMQEQSFAHDRRLNGMAHGFWELDTNGQRILGHAGSHFIYNSLALLFPYRRLAVFVVTNSAGGDAFVGEGFTRFVQDFSDHFFPEARPAPVPPPDFAARADRFTGSYGLLLGRAETTPEKLLSMFMAVEVQAEAGGLAVALPGGRAHFVEEEPLVFRQAGGPGLLLFRADGAGRPVQAFLHAVPLTALVRRRGIETPAFQLPFLLACAVLLASAIVAAPLGWLRGLRNPAARPGPAARRARILAVALALACLGALAAALGSALDLFGTYVGRLPLWTWGRPLSVVAALLAAAAAALAALAWTRRWYDLAGRLHYTLVAAAGVGCTWFLWFWGALGTGF
jgi:CubicO group peptidase (beta-lactamase class C family)